MQKLNGMIKIRSLEPETNEFIAVKQLYFMKTFNEYFQTLYTCSLLSNA